MLHVTCYNSYHQYETFILQDYQEKLGEGIEIEKSGAMFLAFRNVTKMPFDFFQENNYFIRPSELDTVQDQLCVDKVTEEVGTVLLGKDEKMIEKIEAGIEGKLEPVSKNFSKQSNNDTLGSKAQYDFFNTLLGHEDLATEEESKKIAIRSAILAKILQKFGYISTGNAEQAIVGIMYLLYKYQFSIAQNTHAIYHLDGELSGDIPLKCVGSAVYRSFVLSNHSCDSNTSRFYTKNRLIVVAKRFIAKVKFQAFVITDFTLIILILNNSHTKCVNMPGA